MQESHVPPASNRNERLNSNQENRVTNVNTPRPGFPGPGFLTPNSGLSPNTPRQQGLGGFSEDITKQIDHAFRIKDGDRVTLSLPTVPELDEDEHAANNPNNDTGGKSKRGDSLTNKFGDLTVGSAKAMNETHQLSDQTQSSPTSSTRAGVSLSVPSGSDATQRTEVTVPSNLAKGKSTLSFRSPKKKGSKPSTPASPRPKIVKYIGSPGDYFFMDLDAPRGEAEKTHPGLLPKGYRTMPPPAPLLDLASLGLNEGDQSQDSKKAHSPQDPKKPKRPDYGPTSTLQKKVDLVRRQTGTLQNPESSETSQSAQNAQPKGEQGIKNLRCTSCFGKCPICGEPCCMYEAAKQAGASDESGGRKPGTEHQLLPVIENMGCRARDKNRFAMCTLGGGCGRYVCSNCYGICPVELCRDVQCKECKPDPWAPCDWHD